MAIECVALERLNRSGDIVVAPVSGWRINPSSKKADDAQAPFLVARPDSDEVSRELARILAAIGRARNLLRIAVAPVTQVSEVQIEMNVVRFKDSADATGEAVSGEHGEPILRIGEEIAFRIKNTGTTVADVTLLLIDADYGITAEFPQTGRETDARIPVNEERQTRRFTVGPPTGAEQMLAIAVPASGARQEFRGLEQPVLHRAVKRSAETEKPRAISDSPLGRLLKGIVQGQGGTRGMRDSDVGQYVMRMLTWRTIPPVSTQ